jgi:dolichyl-phosphate-mannose--protein O-mannosyl transferase
MLITRCTWTYHYEPALMFGVLALCQAIGKLTRRWQWPAAALVGIAATGALWYWFPWVYAVKQPIEKHAELMIWEQFRKAFGAPLPGYDY